MERGGGTAKEKSEERLTAEKVLKGKEEGGCGLGQGKENTIGQGNKEYQWRWRNEATPEKEKSGRLLLKEQKKSLELFILTSVTAFTEGKHHHCKYSSSS